jgi:hypothetical protein
MTDQDEIAEVVAILDEMRALYEKGPIEVIIDGEVIRVPEHKQAIMAGMIWCVQYNLPFPPWLAAAFRQACDKVSSREVKSWDDVFGEPVMKGQRLYNLRRDLQIVRRIQELRAAGGSLTRAGIFAEVGEEFNLTDSVIERIYYRRHGSRRREGSGED